MKPIPGPIDRIAGSPEVFDLRHRILNLLMFLATLAGIFFFIQDNLIGLSSTGFYFEICLMVVFSSLYGLARFKGMFSPVAHFAALAGLALLTFNFFDDEGIQGPTLILALMVSVFITILHKSRTSGVYLVVLVGIIGVGIVIQYLVPGWFPPYPSTSARFLDVSCTMLFCLVMMFLVVRMLMQFFQESLDKVNDAQTIAAQAEKMASLGEMLAVLSHEVGTPVGVLGSSLERFRGWWTTELPRLPPLLDALSDEGKAAFWLFLSEAAEFGRETPPDSRSHRARRDQLKVQLEGLGLSDVRDLADDLAELGLGQWKPGWLPLVNEPGGRPALEFLFRALLLERTGQMALRAQEKVKKLVTALGTYSRTSRPGEERHPTSLEEGVDTVLTLYTPSRPGDLEVIRNFQTIPPVMARPDELIQVWTNLVQNALQAMDRKGVLTLTLGTDGPWAVVTVSDTGPGVPDALKEKIFQPYFTTKERGLGTGLGLRIVKKIVTDHGGSVEVVDAPGGGARFVVRLPLAT